MSDRPKIDPQIDYVPRTQPYAHQAKALANAGDNEYHAWFMEMGTGKTKVGIDNIAMLHLQGKLTGALIVAPKSVYLNWCHIELPKHLPENIDAVIYAYSAAAYGKKLKELEKFLTIGDSAGVLCILLMNVEALSKPRGQKIARTFLRNHFETGMMIVDESTTIKNHSAKRTKGIIDVGTFAKYRRIMTGMAITQSPMDLYSQCRFLSVNALGFKSYYAFRGRYAELETKRFGNHSFLNVKGYCRLDELKDRLQTFSTRVTKAECLDLPDKVYTQRFVEMTDEHRKLYNEFKEEAYLELENSETVVAPLVLTQLLRLHQIACGFVPTATGELHKISNTRVETLLEVLEETDGKALIWCTYTSNIEEVVKAIEEKYGEDSVRALYGKTAMDERKDLMEQFQMPDSRLRYIVGHPKSGGFGLTLTEASTVVYFSNSYDLELRVQSEDRAHRIGQKKSVVYVDLVVPRTIDEVILKNLRAKKNLADQVLHEGWRSIFDQL